MQVNLVNALDVKEDNSGNGGAGTSTGDSAIQSIVLDSVNGAINRRQCNHFYLLYSFCYN